VTIIREADAPCFQLPGLTVRGLASPRRGARETSVWRILLAPGTPGTPHAVTREEVFVATAGTAQVTLAGGTSELRTGDALVVPAGVPFSLANVGDEPFEAIVSFPVGGQAVVGDGAFTPPWAE
jgi:mannose-6-phosphate isomerase-like protein (cupin superfamily)